MKWIAHLKKDDTALYIAAFVLLIPALFIGLGYMPLMSDEGIRALVALEMDFDGHYFTPTINGHYYFNKPPLYNWMVLGFFKLFDSHSLYVFRLPNLLMGLLFGGVIYQFGRYFFSAKKAALAALLFLTCGRVLFNDFHLGLMALTHGMVLFLNFWVLFHFYRKQNWVALFTLSYLLIAVTFLMKGLQGVAAQAITLPVFFLWKKDFKRLFHWQHFFGFFVFVGTIAVYMGIYHQLNPDVFNQYIATLWDQSEQRTFLEYGWIDNVVHLFTYPFKVVYAILPYGFIVFLLFKKAWWARVKKHEFLAFAALMFAANNLVYLASPFWHARYIFFLLPLLFYLLLDAWENPELTSKKVSNFLNQLWLGLAIVAALGAIVFPFTPLADGIEHTFLVTALLLIAFGVLIYSMIQIPQSRLILFVLVLIVARYGSDFLYMKAYSHQIKEYQHRQLAIEAAQFSAGTPLHLYQAPYLSEDVSYYIARERGETLKREFKYVNAEDYYAIDSKQRKKLDRQGRNYTVLFNFETRSRYHTMHMVQFDESFTIE